MGPAKRAIFRFWAWLQSCCVDTWVVMHATMRDDVARLCGATPVAVIPDPALTKRQVASLRGWQPRNDNQLGYRFVALGRLAPQKNYEMLLHAFARGGTAEDHLTIYGEGESRVALELLTDELELGSRLTFAGHVPDSASYLFGKDALLMTSHFEGIPATLVEAMTCGMPIVATSCGTGVRALLEDYQGGSIVARGDTAAVAGAIAKFVPANERSSNFEADSYTIEVGALAYVETFTRVRDLQRL